jgi:hypothetical protein
MRYLKTFESVDLENDLKDFCETYLAYLLDEDFQLDVIWMGHDYIVIKSDCYTINLIKLNDYGATGFTWNEVKDSYIPFLHMLDKQYEIMDEGEGSRTSGQWDVPCICLYNGSQNFCVSVKDILSGKPLPNRYDDVRLLEITLQVMMKKITESVELKLDDIEHYLAYLIDEDFEVKSIIKGGGFSDVQPQQSISMERKLSPTEWNSIYNCGLTHKVVILGIGNNPLKVFDTPHNGNRKESLLSSYNCGLLTQVDERAHEAADRLLLDFPEFSISKIIISFKVGEGQYQQYDFGNLSIRLQIILIE